MSDDLAEIRRELGNLRQGFGGLQTEVRDLGFAITRLEGASAANRERMATMATAWAAHAATMALRQNIGRGIFTMIASMIAGATGYLASLIHRW